MFLQFVEIAVTSHGRTRAALSSTLEVIGAFDHITLQGLRSSAIGGPGCRRPDVERPIQLVQHP
ncbi:protein of unknown function (plasmid) [Caballeronia sp. S22]